MAHEQHFPSNERFSHSERYSRPIKPSRKSLILYGLLFAVLLVIAVVSRILPQTGDQEAQP